MFSVVPGDCLQSLKLGQIFRTELFPLLSFALNNLSLVFVFCCFSVLYLPPHIRPGAAPLTTDVRPPQGLWLRFVAFRRRLVAKFSDPNIDERELRQRILVVTFAAVIVVLTLSFPLIMLTKNGARTNWSEYPAVFDALSGTINAIVLALLIARLDSKLIGLPSSLICVLYFYAGVQPMFVVFELHPEVYAGIKTAVLWVVFIFKIYFFLIIFYSLQTGRMFNYFFCSEILNDHVKALKESLSAESESKIQAASDHLQRHSEPSTATPQEQSPQEAEQAPQIETVDDDLRAIWFKRLGVVAIVFFAGSLLFYVSLSEEYKHWIDGSRLSDYVVRLHLLLLIIICGVVIRAWYRETKNGFLPNDQARFQKPAELRFRLDKPDSAYARKRTLGDLSNRTNEQFKSFTHYFRLFWISLLLLYTAMWLSGRGETTKPYESFDCPVAAVGQEMAAALSNEQPVQPSASSEHSQTPAAQVHSSGATPVKKSEATPTPSPQVAEKLLSIHEMDKNVKYSFVFFVLNNFTVLILFWCFTVLYIPADDGRFDEKHRLLRNYAVLVFVLLTVLVPLLAVIVKGNAFTPSDADKIPTILGAIGGTLNAVAFALLIARLDSRIIGLRSLLVTVLYGYAALQPLFITFNQPSNLLKFVATSAMIAAFVFKICLVLMVGHIRRSGGLIDYLWFFPVISNSVNSIFGNQFEIKAYSPKPGSFTFSIFNNNVETYRASEMYDTRAKCDHAIKTVVDAMKKKGNYSSEAEKLQGIHWIQVSLDGQLLCESKGLRSQSEADELIDESIDNVPNCKYDRG
jgi:uncharacterized protein YegP (UPF0339 family)